MYLYKLTHKYRLNEHFECKDIGTYSSENNALKAIEALKTKPGFCDTPNGFKIKKIFSVFKPKLIDRTYWVEGFDTYTYDLNLWERFIYFIKSKIIKLLILFRKSDTAVCVESEHVETVTCLNRQINVHNMKLHASPFEMIKSGQKTIELRLFDEKRQQIKAGDQIVFTNTATGETLNTTVVKLHCFDSFEELYKSLPLLQCGYTAENVNEADPSDMEQYYSVEEQKKYGVVGIELFRPEEITD